MGLFKACPKCGATCNMEGEALDFEAKELEGLEKDRQRLENENKLLREAIIQHYKQFGEEPLQGERDLWAMAGIVETE